MNDFLLKNIEEKKKILKELPLKTKKNKELYNETIDIIKEKYENYKIIILKEMNLRKDSLNIITDDTSKQRIEKLNNKIKYLKEDMYILNSDNDSVEKLNLDSQFYILKNFSEFSYDFLMKTINDAIIKFENASIHLNREDFFYNFYVYEFMNKFLELRKTGSNDYSTLTPLFEKYYWHNPEIFYHIALNFRSLTYKYGNKLDKYVKSIQNNVKELYNIENFDDSKRKLKETYSIYNKLNQEKIEDVFNYAKSGEIDIKNYLKTSKVKNEIFKSFLINELKDEYSEEKFYADLEKLKFDLEQYIKYNEIKPLVNVFKEHYQELIVDNKVQATPRTLKNLRDQIIKREKKVKKDKDLYYGKNIFKRDLTESFKKNMSNVAIDACNELDKIYDQLTINYFVFKLKQIIGNPITINDFLYIYYTFDYFKKGDIKKAYGNLSYKDLEEKCNEFDSYASDPTHELINSLALFKDSELEKIIVTKHRLNNIAITVDDVTGDAAKETLNKVNLLLRTKIIEKSNITAEQILFILTTEKILEKENFTENTLIV